MALEDVIRMAMEAGVRRFVLEDLSEEDEQPIWHWDLYSEDPVRWFRWPHVTWGIHRGSERAGCQGIDSATIEEGLAFALRSYLCEFDAATCEHVRCPDHGVCEWTVENRE